MEWTKWTEDGVDFEILRFAQNDRAAVIAPSL